MPHASKSPFYLSNDPDFKQPVHFEDMTDEFLSPDSKVIEYASDHERLRSFLNGPKKFGVTFGKMPIPDFFLAPTPMPRIHGAVFMTDGGIPVDDDLRAHRICEVFTNRRQALFFEPSTTGTYWSVNPEPFAPDNRLAQSFEVAKVRVGTWTDGELEDSEELGYVIIPHYGSVIREIVRERNGFLRRWSKIRGAFEDILST